MIQCSVRYDREIFIEDKGYCVGETVWLLSREMKGMVSPDETPGKVVGRRLVGGGLNPISHTKERARQWSEAMKTPFVPRGVYRFKSHEEADEWMWKMISRKTS